jgi:hypothetical protein
MGETSSVMSPRASAAASVAVAGAILAVGLGSSSAGRIGGLIAACVAASAIWFFWYDPPPVLDAGETDVDAQEREVAAQQTLRDIMRRRNAKIWVVVGLMFLTAIVIGYGPWSS